MNYYIADMHWGQADVIEYDQRPFADAAECYDYMKEQWNQVVTPEDHVYIIGDCLWEEIKEPNRYLEGLNGHLHLAIGNNDYNLITSSSARYYFEEIENIITAVDEEGRIIVMCHYPIACWEHRNNEKCIHVYGHVHRDGVDEFRFMNERGNAYNAGCMLNGYVPVTMEQLIKNNKRHY